MEFHNIIFSEEGNFFEVKDIYYQNLSTLIIQDVFPKEMKLSKDKNYIGYFLVEEDNKDISGITRLLKIDLYSKKSFQAVYDDFVPDCVRDLYDDSVEIISKYVGLRKIVNSFNELIIQSDMNNNYEFWLDDIVQTISFDKREIVAQRITRFVNLYLIKVYEGFYKRNQFLLKKYESEITFKILETAIMQKIY
ncbi:hypothetical protein [Petrotoga sp. 9PWA.NaAc.5.4]|uniref:hypothetical protein n=1 Tax=Petrotoga sp. 9PWA.NaAc.5.4 TaxID=1434328 RepID=UPI000CBB4F98|nr:hypothetical protein [Petrotoga sp. 9PWA.NaAc.5.4]PNR95798.1 hypothetical protein X924_03755 [Petrotoga sp. 9PWA.NaAc.5.4]